MYSILLTVLILNSIIFFKNNFILKKYGIFSMDIGHLNNNVSLVGGFYFIINIFIISTLFFYLSFEDVEILFGNKRSFYSFVISISLFFVLGFFDDKYDLRPNIKLFSSFFIIFLNLSLDENLIIQYLNFSQIFYIYLPSNLQIFFIILCFLSLLNFFNMFDGINLQSISFTILVIFFLILNSYSLYLLIILIPLFLLLYLNSKNILYIGNAGSLSISYFIGFLIIKFYKSDFILADQVILLFIIPFLDMIRLIIIRSISKNPVFRGDKNHIHHLISNKHGNLLAFLIIKLIIFIPNLIGFLFSQNISMIIVSFLLYVLIITVYKKNEV